MKDGWDGVRRAGFTIIEVMLFLAISGFLLVGILVGTGTGIARQRYNDSVQDFAQLLREQYSAVENIQVLARDAADAGACYTPSVDQLLGGGEESINWGRLSEYYDSTDGNSKANIGRGRTSCLVYGRVVMISSRNDGVTPPRTVVQSTSLIGRDIDAMKVQGEITDSKVDGMTDLEVLKVVGANSIVPVFEYVGGSGSSLDSWRCWVRTTEGAETHELPWQARAENPDESALNATLLIVRSPKDGAIRTYLMRNDIRVAGSSAIFNYAVLNSENGGKGRGLVNAGGSCAGSVLAGDGAMLLDQVEIGKFLVNVNEDGNEEVTDEEKRRAIDSFRRGDSFLDIDRADVGSVDDVFNDVAIDLLELNICVDSNDIFASAGQRRMIRLAKYGHNASAVELLPVDVATADGSRNLCNL